MALFVARVVVAAGGAAVKVFEEGARIVGQTVILSNVGANPADVGGPTVTGGAGFPLAAGASTPPFTLRDDDDDVFVASTLGTTIAVLAVGS